MDTSLNIEPATPEIVWAILREISEKQLETDKKFEQVWIQSQETGKRLDQVGLQIKETGKRLDQVGLQIKETGKQIWLQIMETGKQIDQGWLQIRKTNQLLGGMAYNQGRFAEEYFFNSFEKGKKNFFGEKFDDIKNNLKGVETNDEFDIVMLNGKSVGIVEVKYKAHENDVPKVLEKVNSFRVNFPKFNNHTIYLGLATMAFYPVLEQACQDNGIAIIKQVGDTIVINDKHLKAF